MDYSARGSDFGLVWSLETCSNFPLPSRLTSVMAQGERETQHSYSLSSFPSDTLWPGQIRWDQHSIFDTNYVLAQAHTLVPSIKMFAITQSAALAPAHVTKQGGPSAWSRGALP